MVVDNDLPAAIVFEDDVELVDGFKEKLNITWVDLRLKKIVKARTTMSSCWGHWTRASTRKGCHWELVLLALHGSGL